MGEATALGFSISLLASLLFRRWIFGKRRKFRNPMLLLSSPVGMLVDDGLIQSRQVDSWRLSVLSQRPN